MNGKIIPWLPIDWSALMKATHSSRSAPSCQRVALLCGRQYFDGTPKKRQTQQRTRKRKRGTVVPGRRICGRFFFFIFFSVSTVPLAPSATRRGSAETRYNTVETTPKKKLKKNDTWWALTDYVGWGAVVGPLPRETRFFFFKATLLLLRLLFGLFSSSCSTSSTRTGRPFFLLLLLVGWLDRRVAWRMAVDRWLCGGRKKREREREAIWNRLRLGRPLAAFSLIRSTMFNRSFPKFEFVFKVQVDFQSSRSVSVDESCDVIAASFFL